jgi:hypothetical protein
MSSAMKSTKQASRRVPPEKSAKLEEIGAAIDSLSKEDLWRLEQYARWRLKGIGRAARGHNYEDLLRESIMATCDPERRRWNIEKVSFVQHLKGVMRSISSHWLEKFDSDEPIFEAESPIPDPERTLAAKEELLQIEMLLIDRPLASLIVDGMKEGHSGAEIKQILEITQTQYETEMKWLRRNARDKARRLERHV